MQGRDTEKAASLIVVCLIIAAVLADKCGMPDMGIGIYAGCPLYARLLHPLAHAGILHAVVNVYVWLQMVFFCDIRTRQMLTAWAIACCCPTAIATLGGAATDHVTGLSGMIYALLGARMPFTKNILAYNGWMAAYLAIGWVVGGTAVAFHLYCYLAGCGIEAIFSVCKRHH